MTSIIFAGVWFDRIPFGSERYYYEDIQCHDCGVTVGQIHHGNCDVEECPICGEQFLSCDCDTEYEKAATITGHNANVYKAIDKNDRPAVLACRIKKLMGSGTIEMQHARMYKNKAELEPLYAEFNQPPEEFYRILEDATRVEAWCAICKAEADAAAAE